MTVYKTTLSLRASPQTGVAIRTPTCGAIHLLAIRFPFAQAGFTGTLRNMLRLGCGLPRRFAPRNDNAGQSPVIEICVLIKPIVITGTSSTPWKCRHFQGVFDVMD